MATGTEEYYAQRAAEYDQVYAKPERQEDIDAVSRLVALTLADRAVIDIAAGTGFWTERFAGAARSTMVCDVNDETLQAARLRRTWPKAVTFARCDAFALGSVPGVFDAAFVGFFWSHIDIERLDGFLDGVVRRLERGAVVAIVDNNYVEGSNHPITRIDRKGNTYQRRRLADGSEWEVRKNFPTVEEVTTRLVRLDPAVTVTSLTYFWVATFRTPDER